MSPWSVDWTDLGGTHHTDPLNINCHCFDVTTTNVLNPNAWTNVPNGQFGDQSVIRDFRGIRTPTENVNFARNFRIKERVNLNLRVEFNNIFNRVQYAIPVGQTTPINLGTLTSTTKFTAGPNKGLYSGGFGTIVPEQTGSVGARSGTIVARIQVLVEEVSVAAQPSLRRNGLASWTTIRVVSDRVASYRVAKDPRSSRPASRSRIYL